LHFITSPWGLLSAEPRLNLLAGKPETCIRRASKHAAYAGVTFDPSKVDIRLQRELVCKDGLAADFDEAAMKEKLDEPEVRIRVTLNGSGKQQARFFTCDLTEGYIEINGSYRT